MNRYIRQGIIVALIIGGGLLFRPQLTNLIAQLDKTPYQVRPAVWLIMAVLAGVGGIACLGAVRSVQITGSAFTWRSSLGSLSLWITAASAFAIPLLMLATADDPKTGPFMWLRVPRVIDLIVPLIVGIQAALLFSPDDEPVLELKLTYPRPFVWLAAERISVTLLVQIAIGLLGTVLALLLKNTDPIQNLVRWLPATVFLAGIGLRVTLATRQIVFGVLIVIGFWFVMWFYGDGMLAQHPFMWPLHLYMQPINFSTVLLGLTNTDYTLNRLMIVLLGIGLMLSAFSELRDEERLLTGAYAIRTQPAKGH